MEGYRIKLNGQSDAGTYKCSNIAKHDADGRFDIAFNVNLGELNKCNNCK